MGVREVGNSGGQDRAKVLPLSASLGQAEMILGTTPPLSGSPSEISWRGMVFILKGPLTPSPHLLLFPPTGSSFFVGPQSLQPSPVSLSGRQSLGTLWDLSPQLETVRLSLSSSQAVLAPGDLR